MMDELRQAHKDGLDEMVYSHVDHIMEVAAESPNLSDEQFDHLMNHGSRHVGVQLATNKHLQEYHLDSLVNHPSSNVRFFVLKHPKCTVKHAEHLANDPISWVSSSAQGALLHRKNFHE